MLESNIKIINYMEWNIRRLLDGVATFNADPYCIENEELAQEIIDQIREYGANLITDDEEIEDAIAKLALSEGTWEIYRAGGCLFAIISYERVEDFGKDSIYNLDTCPSDNNIITVDDGTLCVQFTLFENQEKTLTKKQVETRCLDAVMANKFDEKGIGQYMKSAGIDCTVEIYHL